MSAARGTETPGVDLGALSEAEAALLADPIFRTVLDALPICCEECRVDPDGAVWHEAAAVREALSGELIPASAVEALAGEWEQRLEAVRALDGWSETAAALSECAEGLRALVADARGGAR